MAYLSQTQEPGQSVLRASPMNQPSLASGPYGAPYGGDAMFGFMRALAETRARRQDRAEGLAGEEAGTRRMEALSARHAREADVSQRERSEALRAALMRKQAQADLSRGELERRSGEAAHAARMGTAPTSVIAGRPGVIGGIVSDPSKGTGYQREAFGPQGAGFAGPVWEPPGEMSSRDPWSEQMRRQRMRNALARPDLFRPGGDEFTSGG